jgi:hypothetical protein
MTVFMASLLGCMTVKFCMFEGVGRFLFLAQALDMTLFTAIGDPLAIGSLLTNVYLSVCKCASYPIKTNFLNLLRRL